MKRNQIIDSETKGCAVSPPDGSIVLILWQDTSGGDGHWQHTGCQPPLSASLCVTAGFVHRQDDRFIHMAGSYADRGTKDECYDGWHVIPKVAVIAWRPLATEHESWFIGDNRAFVDCMSQHYECSVCGNFRTRSKAEFYEHMWRCNGVRETESGEGI